uniref:Band 3 cytoplasmic domain-containing protein n=1 Tax=Biomphalaria glabrata TaxID=6526 RepID=A0A2C9K5R2_BIOGL
MVGEVEDLKTTLCGLVRLNDGRIIGDISEVSLPTRFVFFLLGPKGSLLENEESARCLSTMLVDEVFREVAYKARELDDIIAGIDEFLEQVTVLPPGEWDPKIRIEPPDKVPDQEGLPSRDILLMHHTQPLDKWPSHRSTPRHEQDVLVTGPAVKL